MTGDQIALSLSGPLTAAAWFVANLIMREKSREAVKTLFSESIHGALAEFEVNFLGKMNGPNGYRRTETCNRTMEPIRDKFVEVDRKLNELHDYSHAARHELKNDVFGLATKLEGRGEGAGKGDNA